jgi:adenine-specific DNA-methyltransferase
MLLKSEVELAAFAAALGAENVEGLSLEEAELLAVALPPAQSEVKTMRTLIERGRDPLGHSLAAIRSPAERRPLGATYTPQRIVAAMVNWAAIQAFPDRVIDPGVGSARFLMQAGRTFRSAKLVGIEVDPLAALVARANLAAVGLANRSQIIVEDYRASQLPHIDGRSLYIGNPPYVRHHLIPSEWKEWLTETATGLGLHASSLAGLHIYFFLATQIGAQAGDYGAFITAAEWLDVNYGRMLRELFLEKLGGEGILIVEPTARPFPDAATTAAITTFEIGSRPKTIRLSKAADVADVSEGMQTGVMVRRERLAAANRWSNLLRAARPMPSGYVELGEICRVHRGAVTGANKVWIAGERSADLPESVLYPTVTKARELFAAGAVLDSVENLRRVIDLPAELDEFDTPERSAIENFLAWARSVGAHEGYIARHRRAWWTIGLRPPPPIMATYMARRPPAFVENRAEARYINIAHGLYPREPMAPSVITRLAGYLAVAAQKAVGRTYAGGLMKFEPGEMERIAVPSIELLQADVLEAAEV